jgi:hypothetical protein
VLPWCYSRFGKLPRASSKLNEGVAFRHCKPFVSEQLRDVSEWHFRLAQRRSECMTAIIQRKGLMPDTRTAGTKQSAL